MKQIKAEWILCPICGNKTRTMIREDTELRNFPLYCPKCKKETIINAQDIKVTLSGEYPKVCVNLQTDVR